MAGHKVFRHSVQDCTLSLVNFGLNAFNVGHPTDIEA
jgi:hypothetical protein